MMRMPSQAGRALVFLLVALSFSLYLSSAIPSGATVTYISNGTAASPTPDGRADEGGYITTITINTLQQDQAWKAYVGNVTGALTLDDADGFTIYDWSFSNVTISGEVYASRNISPDFDVVVCANSTTIGTEETFHNMTGSDVDSITNTFNYTNHTGFLVGGSGAPSTITADTCPSTALYVNDTTQAINDSTLFQQILLRADASILFTTIIEDNELGYRNDSTYDFQLILPESDVKGTPTTYYFFLEIN